MWNVVGEPLGVDPPAFGPVDLADDPAMGLDQDLAVLGEAAEQEVARLQFLVDDRRRGQPVGQGLQAVQAVELGPDRGLPPGVDERRRGRVGGERRRVEGDCKRRAHPADVLPGDVDLGRRSSDGGGGGPWARAGFAVVRISETAVEAPETVPMPSGRRSRISR